MKYLFFGTPEFAAIILDKLIAAGLPPAAVVCNPDRPVGRKKIVMAPPTKVLAQKHGIAVWQPESLEIKNWKLEIEKLGAIEFAIVAAYNKIIPKEILDSLPTKFLGIHPSLLPKHRGPTPIQTAILNGDSETGVTLFLLDEKVDHGPILAAEVQPLAVGDDYESLIKKLASQAAELLIATLPKFLKGEIKPQPQNEIEATYTKKFSASDAYVDLDKDDPELILRKLHALNPEPGVWTVKDGRRIKILDAEISNGRLKLKKIQPAGKKPLTLG